MRQNSHRRRTRRCAIATVSAALTASGVRPWQVSLLAAPLAVALPEPDPESEPGVPA